MNASLYSLFTCKSTIMVSASQPLPSMIHLPIHSSQHLVSSIQTPWSYFIGKCFRYIRVPELSIPGQEGSWTQELALASTLLEHTDSSQDICQAGTGQDGYHQWGGTRGWHQDAVERYIPQVSLKVEGELVQQGLCFQTDESIVLITLVY